MSGSRFRSRRRLSSRSRSRKRYSDSSRSESFGMAVAESCLYELESPIERVTGWDTVFPLKRGEHLYLPGVERIQEAIERTLS